LPTHGLLFVGLLLVQQGDLKVVYFLPMFAAAVILAFLFVFVERREKNPLLQLGIFRKKEFSSGLASAYLAFVSISATMLFLPFYLQTVLKLSPLSAGLIIAFNPVTTMIVAPLSGWLSDRISYRPLTVAGMSVCTASLLLMLSYNTVTPVWMLILLNIMFGFGNAMFMSPNNSSIMGAVPKPQLGVAGGINALFRNIGMVSGNAFSLLLFSVVTSLGVNSLTEGAGIDAGVFLKGFHAVLVFNAVCTFLAAIVNISRAVAFAPGKTASR
jgi:MFS family permease